MGKTNQPTNKQTLPKILKNLLTFNWIFTYSINNLSYLVSSMWWMLYYILGVKNESDTIPALKSFTIINSMY